MSPSKNPWNKVLKVHGAFFEEPHEDMEHIVLCEKSLFRLRARQLTGRNQVDGLEKDLPHHFFTPEELSKLFKDFEITDIHLDSGEHYCLLGIRS